MDGVLIVGFKGVNGAPLFGAKSRSFRGMVSDMISECLVCCA